MEGLVKIFIDAGVPISIVVIGISGFWGFKMYSNRVTEDRVHFSDMNGTIWNQYQSALSMIEKQQTEISTLRKSKNVCEEEKITLKGELLEEKNHRSICEKDRDEALAQLRENAEKQIEIINKTQ